MNKVCISGRLTRDSELRFAAGSGNAVTRLNIAVRRNIKDKNTGKYESDFINCVAFGKQAETIAQYFQKGSQIAITGHIQTGSYNAQDGSKRYTTNIYIETFEFVGNNNNQNNNNQNNNFGDDLTPVSDDDMPF